MKKTICLAGVILLSACSAPPPPPIPSLTPEQAAGLLHFNNRASNWLIYVKKQNPACGYKLDLPDQSTHPTEVDMSHIVWCGSAASPKEFDASVVFVYDKAAGKWTVSRFSS
ncbi:MAG: hypothetical protein M3Y57_10705 [Acidobacteriota bacterium]|nr:hypothetical protein [Acidobacteriota bacterium]